MDSFIAFTSTILRTASGGRLVLSDHLVQAVAELQSAVLAEAQESAMDESRPISLRSWMEEYIETHHADRDLGPATVARAIGISIRRAHQAFDDDGRTIARFIRERRVAAVAYEIRTKAEPVRFAYLAQAHGFGSTDSLARAFRAEFGMTLTDYRKRGPQASG